MRVLVIEDREVDYFLVERALGGQFDLVHAASLGEGLKKAAAEKFGLIILDLSLDDCKGYETFEKARDAVSPVPIIILSGSDDEDLALRAVSNGAQDFVRKSQLLDYPLDRTARYAIERRRFIDAAKRSEQHFRALFDNLPTPAFTCDSQGLITYFNQKAVELWGRIPKLNNLEDRYSGSYKLYTVDGDLLPHDESFVARALRECRSFNGVECLIERPDGERRSALVHVNLIWNEDKSLDGAMAVLVDISRQRHAEQQLRESERFARSAVDSVAAHVAIIDQKGKILTVNAAWRRFAENNGQCGRGFGVGLNYLEVCDRAAGKDADNAPAVAESIRAILRGERSELCHDYPCHSPNEERWFAMRVLPFEGIGPRRAVIAHWDITSQKVAERLAREQGGLREAVEGMEQVLGVVGHELRTPLAALRAISELLTTDGAKDTAESDRFLRDMSDEVDRMSDTVNNLLEAARLNSGRARWNWSEIDVVDVIDEALASIQPLVDSENIRLVTRVEASIGTMRGDADAIRRILVNLLSNARKHTRQGQIEISVRRHLDGPDFWIDLMVSDTGGGISPDICARLGEAFALNAGVVGSNHVTGTGLGLAICKGIAVAHGGELLIESVQGKGTMVIARLRGDLEAAICGDTVQAGSTEEILL